MDQRPNNYNDQGPNGQGPNGNGGPGGPKNKSSLLVLLICVLATLLIWTVFSNILQSSTSKEITYDKFLEMLDKGEVKSVELQSGVLTIVPREQKVEGVEFEYSTTAMEDSTTLTARLLEAEQKTGNKITFNEIQPDPTGSIIYTILSLLVPFVFLIILMNWLMRKMNKGGGMMGVGKSKAKAYVQQETGVTFKDVAGEDEAKVTDNYIIWDSLKYDEQNNILNPIQFDQYETLIEEIEKEGLADVEKKEIYEKADENLENIISVFLSEFNGYKIKFM